LVFANADEPGTIVAARRSTPLVLGVGDGEMFVASDVAAFIEYTRDAVELGQDQAVVITADGYRITDFHGDDVSDYRKFHIDWDMSAAERGGHEYWTRLPVEVELASEFRYRDPDAGPQHAGGGDFAVR
jgi:glucosamine--fructose-6-phosphate aminotransferase (isomerizing)